MVLADGSAAKATKASLTCSQRNCSLIIHADDFGLSESINDATIRGWECGAISSASVMAPCSAFDRAIRYAVDHPGMDIGVHLTLTSEWPNVRWAPIAGKSTVTSLVDRSGYLWPDIPSLARFARAADVETELRAQLNRVVQSGIKPSHMDCHMHSLFHRMDLCKLMFALSREYRLPVVAPRGKWMELLEDADRAVALDSIFQATPAVPADEWRMFYCEFLCRLPDGVHELIVHPGFATPEMEAITGTTSNWGGHWRQRDFDAITSDTFRNLLVQNNITVTTWKTISNG